MKKEIKVAAARGDGLGQRLYAIINAIYIAKKLNVDYGFTWSERFVGDKDHAISLAGEFFSKEYIEDHLIAKEDLAGFKIPGGRGLTKKKLLTPLSNDSVKGWIATNSHLRNVLATGLLPNDKYNLLDAFNEIKFSDRINECIEFAKTIELPANPVAIHLRAGDVVYGDYRKWGKFVKKTIPISLAKMLVEFFKKKNATVLVFGQNQGAIKELAAEHDIIQVKNLYSHKYTSNIEEAMLDLILMTRCSEVISGASGFALQASLIGGIPNKSPTDYFSAADITNYVENDLKKVGEKRYSPLDVAHGYWFLWSLSRKSVSFESALGWISLAAAQDSGNPIYPFKKAISLIGLKSYEAGDMELGKAMLIGGSEEKFNSELFKILVAKTPPTYLLESDFKYVHHAAALGYLNAIAVSAMINLVLGNVAKARSLITDALLMSPGAAHFVDILRKVISAERKKPAKAVPAKFD
ncbi:MAG: hypothetical protein Q7J29_05505 [Stagnimonas sp.]|nr:hypothetical protein [Stagnimonas sp.]